MMKRQKLTKVTEDLRQQLSIWRETHRPPSPIPAELWEKAVELAEEQGLGKTARALRLDYGALKKRLGAGSSADLGPAGAPSGIQFVEWLHPLSGSIAGCVMEVESFRGGRLRVEMGKVTPSGLASILREFAG
jgi:hypothetical protein